LCLIWIRISYKSNLFMFMLSSYSTLKQWLYNTLLSGPNDVAISFVNGILKPQ
jgi:hypothetical protein